MEDTHRVPSSINRRVAHARVGGGVGLAYIVIFIIFRDPWAVAQERFVFVGRERAHQGMRRGQDHEGEGDN